MHINICVGRQGREMRNEYFEFKNLEVHQPSPHTEAQSFWRCTYGSPTSAGGTFYEQQNGAALSSPISTAVANLCPSPSEALLLEELC